MAEEEFRQQQWDLRYDRHIAPINRYVDELRQQGRGWAPYVAPVHGGVEARVLTILRDPGPATQDGSGSGFLCIENDDRTAELQLDLVTRAGLSTSDLLPWNAYPWYINRAPNSAELDAGATTILELLQIASRIQVVMLQGKDAAHTWKRVLGQRPSIETDRDLTVIASYHPSPQALFARDPEERARRAARREQAFVEAATALH